MSESETPYVFDRGRPFVDPITEERARALFEEASRRPGADLKGTLEGGFEWTAARSGADNFLRVAVRPIAEYERPATPPDVADEVGEQDG
jgi:hypothetical protein